MAFPTLGNEQPRVNCCSPEFAAAWLDAITELALTGDPDGLRVLPEAVQHYLEAIRNAGG